MTKTKAIQQARAESAIYRQGSSWVLSTRDPKVRARRLHEGLTHSLARTYRADWVRARAAELQES